MNHDAAQRYRELRHPPGYASEAPSLYDEGRGGRDTWVPMRSMCAAVDFCWHTSEPQGRLVAPMTETDKLDNPKSFIARPPKLSAPGHGNFVKAAVCELRFPLLMGLGGARPPENFLRALRKQYPSLDRNEEISMGPAGQSDATAFHVLKAIKGKWAVVLKQSSVVLETNTYCGYEDFRARLVDVINAAAPIIDSDFWTRIGLRYQNQIPVDNELADLPRKINEPLISTLLSGVFSSVGGYSGKILGGDSQGGYTLMYSLQREASSRGTNETSFFVDVDVWHTEVNVVDTLDRIDRLHEEAFAAFDWSVRV